MESVRIIDYGFDPAGSQVWAQLDGRPSRSWSQALEGALDDDIRRFAPAVVDGNRVYLDCDGIDEFDGLSLVHAYVNETNARLAHPASLRPHPHTLDG